jgi:hypothetical protein
LATTKVLLLCRVTRSDPIAGAQVEATVPADELVHEKDATLPGRKKQHGGGQSTGKSRGGRKEVERMRAAADNK